MASEIQSNSSIPGVIDIGAKAVSNVIGILGCISERSPTSRLDRFYPPGPLFKIGAVVGLGTTVFQAIRGFERVIDDKKDIGGWLLLASGIFASAAIFAGFAASRRSDLDAIFSLLALPTSFGAFLLAPLPTSVGGEFSIREFLSILGTIGLVLIYPKRL